MIEERLLYVWWKGMVGRVLTESKNHYLLALGKICQFVPKAECSVVKHETQ